jgi:hypothetical protein
MGVVIGLVVLVILLGVGIVYVINKMGRINF